MPERPDLPEYDGDGSHAVAGDGDLADPALLQDAIVLSESGYRPLPSIRAQLRRHLRNGDDPAEAVGKLELRDLDLPHWRLGGVSRSLPDEEAARLYLYRELVEVPDHLIASRLDGSAFRDSLNLSDDVSERTVGNIADRIEDEIASVRPLLQDVVRKTPEPSEELIDPPTIEADGTGPPEQVELSREMRQLGYGAIQLDRDQTQISVDKWEVFKPYEFAAITNTHLNDAPNGLQVKRYYYSRSTPSGDTLWNQVRERSRSELRAMFLCAYEQLLRVIRDAGYLPDNPDLAVDLTDWNWFGKFDDEDTPYEEREQPPGVEGTKPSRNSSHAFQMASVSLTNTPLPVTLGLRAVSKRRNRDYHLGHLLRYAESVVEPEIICLDRDFYTEDVKDKLENHDVDFVLGANRGMDRFEDLVSGTFNLDRSWNSCPYEIGVGDERPNDEKDHYLFVNPSEKRLSRSSTGLSDYSNWEAYYTNINPEEFDGGGAALADRYRLRWAIETAYRKLKHEFLPKSGSSLKKKREFLMQLAVLWNDAWLAANAKYADEQGLPVKDDHGRYHFTANEFMSATLNDFAPIDIGEITDLSERSKMVKWGMRRER